MIKLFEFIPNEYKKEKEHLCSPVVPEFWGGYYVIFKPKKGKKFWCKYYFSTDKSKTFKNAFDSINIIDGHKHWNEWLNGH